MARLRCAPVEFATCGATKTDGNPCGTEYDGNKCLECGTVFDAQVTTKASRDLVIVVGDHGAFFEKAQRKKCNRCKNLLDTSHANCPRCGGAPGPKKSQVWVRNNANIARTWVDLNQFAAPTSSEDEDAESLDSFEDENSR